MITILNFTALIVGFFNLLLFVILTEASHFPPQYVSRQIMDVNYTDLVEDAMESGPSVIVIGPCIINLRHTCPDSNINFFLYSRKYWQTPEPIHVGANLQETNITRSAFDGRLPTKVIVHGYNSDMHIAALQAIKDEYLERSEYNIFSIDWPKLAVAPCYPAAVWNSRHVGICLSQLIERLHDLNARDIHVLGFSLGAHVAGFAANGLRPYKLPRITGLDPAMPLFVFVSADNKLDPSDAEFVDVFHTNAFFQGQVEQSGHVDFYMNGGVIQPGCWAENRFFACNHHRAPLYFAESINTKKGFWGWPCKNYYYYLMNLCPPIEPQIVAGEFVDRESRGFHLIITDSVSPYAVGEFTGSAIEIYRNRLKTMPSRQEINLIGHRIFSENDVVNFNVEIHMQSAYDRFRDKLVSCKDDCLGELEFPEEFEFNDWL